MLRRHYATLRKVADDSPDRLWQLHQQLRPDARLAAAANRTVNDLENSLLCSYIEAAGSGWEVWKPKLQRHILEADKGSLDRFEQSRQHCRNPELAAYVSLLIRSRR
jgi:hypothetical protein